MNKVEIIKTDIPCPSCGVALCNLCGFNGACQDCGKPLSPEVDAAVVAYIERHAKRDSTP